jgi:O-antigen/teichoic acid export membrane protein
MDLNSRTNNIQTVDAVPAEAPLPPKTEFPQDRRDSNDHHFGTQHLLADLKARTVSSSLITMVSQGIQFALNLTSIAVLARLLSPQDFGLVAMVTTIMGFLRVFKDAGLSTATVQREGITHAQVSNLFWINVALSGAVSLLVAASAPLIAWFYREPRLVPITLALSITFILTVQLFNTWLS